MSKPRQATDQKGRPRCQEWVHSGERWDYQGHQCERIARFDPDVAGPTKCKTHSEEGVKERRAKADARYEASVKQSSRYKLAKAKRRIADAIEVLERDGAQGVLEALAILKETP